MGVPLSVVDEVGNPPPPPRHPPLSPHQRRQRRAAITLLILVFFLVLALLFAGAYYLGWFGKTTPEDKATACHPATATIAPSEVKVNVYNSTNRNGLARGVATTMRTRGFLVEKVANDPLKAKIKISADVRYGPKGKTAAELVAQQIPGAKLVEVKRKDASVDLVLGTAYKAFGPITSSSTPSTAPTCHPTTSPTATSTTTAKSTAKSTAKTTAKSTAKSTKTP
jgi:hypothetical protein